MNLVRSERKWPWPNVLHHSNIYVDGGMKNVRVTGVSLPSFEQGTFRTQVKSALELTCKVMVLL
jgi:phage tail tube protein FII